MLRNCSRKQFANRLRLQRKNATLKAELWDGTMVARQQSASSLFIQIGEASTTVRPYVVDWIPYDTILGKLELSEADPEI